MAKMTLRGYARGKPCMVRLWGCTGDPAETVLGHKNGAGGSMKHHDIHGSWVCASCHSWVDGGYSKTHTRYDRDAQHDAAIIRTQQELLKTENRHGQTLAEAIEQWAKGLET